jgi:hypothetical protein
MSKKINFMRDKDIDLVNNNVDNIIEKARNREIQIIEPTLSEFKKVNSIILDFIKKEKKIIYGGYAWNTLIKKVTPSDAFYTDNAYIDVEFYSNKPIEDVKKLCDILQDKGFKFIQGKSAQHEDTYTIFVNFTAYCDISYMPSNLFNSIMTENIDGFRMIHPKFIMVDILRQFNDPLTSFWRLDKNIKRGKLIIKNFPLELSTKPFTINKLDNDVLKLMDYLIPNLVKSEYIIFIGQIAFNTFANPNTILFEQKSYYDSSPIEIISTNLVKDVETAYNIIFKYFMDINIGENFADKILLEQFHPFFQFVDKKVYFKYGGNKFLTIYGNNEKCIPYHNISMYYKNKSYPIKICTFNFHFMINLIKFHHAYLEKNKKDQNMQDYIMYQLITFRNNFFKANNKNILDQTIFEDFKVECLGIPVSPIRKFMLSRRKRKLLPKSAIYPYDPEERRNNYPIDIYSFNNYSGNIINNPKDLIYNLKNIKSL